MGMVRYCLGLGNNMVRYSLGMGTGLVRNNLVRVRVWSGTIWYRYGFG